ncbi:MAG: DUF1786 domain-containing protein [Candidatus Aenigmarchaeota archaeon]|nr:DUF1786 domain-containing protein [Candidatus Aenigmarchaeota archaeon]
MRILAIDIGDGTKDTLVYDEDKEFNYKLVLPSPTSYFADEVRSAKEDLIIYGSQMGGSRITPAVKEHRKNGYKVYMTSEAAKTIWNDLDVVRSYGIEIISDDEVNKLKGKRMKIGDVDLEETYQMLSSVHIDPKFDVIAVAVQDHGVAPKGESNRKYKFEFYRKKLEVSRRPESFAYLNKVPEELSRMKSVENCIRKLYDGNLVIMDTGPAACLGMLEDEQARGRTSVVVINLGSQHTIAMSLKNGEICGLFEHHTTSMNYIKLMDLERKLSNATLSFEEIFEEGGHGAISLEPNQPDPKQQRIVLITGPKREIAKGLVEMSNFCRYAAPAGDVMLPGCIGLVKAAQYLLSK